MLFSSLLPNCSWTCASPSPCLCQSCWRQSRFHSLHPIFYRKYERSVCINMLIPVHKKQALQYALFQVVVNFSRSMWTLYMLCCVRNMLRMCKAVYSSGPIGCLPCPQHWQRNRNTEWLKSRLFAIRAKHSESLMCHRVGRYSGWILIALPTIVWPSVERSGRHGSRIQNLAAPNDFLGFGDFRKKPMGFVTTFFSNQPTTDRPEVKVTFPERLNTWMLANLEAKWAQRLRTCVDSRRSIVQDSGLILLRIFLPFHGGESVLCCSFFLKFVSVGPIFCRQIWRSWRWIANFCRARQRRSVDFDPFLIRPLIRWVIGRQVTRVTNQWHLGLTVFDGKNPNTKTVFQHAPVTYIYTLWTLIMNLW